MIDEKEKGKYNDLDKKKMEEFIKMYSKKIQLTLRQIDVGAKVKVYSSLRRK